MSDARKAVKDAARLLKGIEKQNEAIKKSARDLEVALVQFRTGDKAITFNVDITADTVWATQQQMAALYERDKRTISEHIQAILAEGELDDSVVRKFRTTGSDGKTYEVTHYDLDMILAVGYRVKSPKAAEFRRWASKVLKSYIISGYALDEQRLREDTSAANSLAAKLREIRSSERSVYANVREFFATSAVDYDPKSATTGQFFAKLQDRFHYAVTGKVASEIILDRADHKESNMGLTTFGGNMPTVAEAKIAKNYLDGDELYTLHLICEAFLIFVESKAVRGQALTMKQLSEKFDQLLKTSDYAVFPGYRDKLKDRAARHAVAEFAMFSMRLKKDDVRRLPR